MEFGFISFYDREADETERMIMLDAAMDSNMAVRRVKIDYALIEAGLISFADKLAMAN